MIDEDAVLAYVRDGSGAEQAEADPEALRDALVDLSHSVAEQLTLRKAQADEFHIACEGSENGRAEWFRYYADYEAWRAKALGFKRHVDARLRHAKRLASKAGRRAHVLEEAIRAHLAEQADPTPADLRLWQAAGLIDASIEVPS